MVRRCFLQTDAPSDEGLHALLQTVITRLTMLTRRCVLIEEMGQTYRAELDAKPWQFGAGAQGRCWGPVARTKGCWCAACPYTSK